MNERTARVVAASFALSAFCVGVVGGLAVGNEPALVLARALIAMGVCWAIGGVIGAIAQHLITGEVDAYQARNPVETVVLPGEEDGLLAGAGGGDDGDVIVV